MGRVLIVGHESHQHKLLGASLTQDGHRVFHADGAEAARLAIRAHRYDAVLIDGKMSDGGATEVLAAARAVDPSVSAIFMNDTVPLGTVVDRGVNNVFELVAKPPASDTVKSVVARACDMTSLLRENSLLRFELHRLQMPSEIFGNTPLVRGLREQIARVAPTSASVLIAGESGTGKELAARAIHGQSARAGKPFLLVNCALPPEILESELFGHEGGARSRSGLFEIADECTVFLDEIAELSESTQSKLHRMLTDGDGTRGGSDSAYQPDARVLAGSRHDLEQRVRMGLFRRDLYERLAIKLVMPPLRERTADIAGLVDLFVNEMVRELKLSPRRLSPEALLQLQSYEFPGNVRELRNLIERAAVLSTREEMGIELFPLRAGHGPGAGSPGNGSATLADPSWIETLPPSFDLRTLLSRLEKTLIERTLQSTRGAQAEAARRLGLSRSDLSYKLLKYELRKETAPS